MDSERAIETLGNLQCVSSAIWDFSDLEPFGCGIYHGKAVKVNFIVANEQGPIRLMHSMCHGMISAI